MIKRQAFYSNGEMIDYRLPNSFVKSTTKQACGNCAMFSNRRGFCGIFKAFGVKDAHNFANQFNAFLQKRLKD